MLRIPTRKYRPELHGLRGLALLGVVLFHLFGNGRVSGGIDIFLAITGFLFVGMMLRESSENSGRINLVRHFGRLFRRIFIPAAVVILSSALLAYAILPSTQLRQTFAEARASLLYYENFELIRSRLAYGAAGPETSLYQHFWSLSVQGQFYLVLPFVFLLLGLFTHRSSPKALVKATGALLILTFVASLTWAIVLGSYAQDEAYLSTWTRLWEFAFGGLLALALDQIRLSNSARLAAGWVGLAMVASSGFLFDGAKVFPGPLALWPLLGWALVMVAGDIRNADGGTFSSASLLTSKPVVWFADRSYAIYLWHWPALIFYLHIRDREAVGIKGAIVVFSVAVILAVLMYRFVEQPVAHDKWTRIGKSLQNNRIMLPSGIAIMLVCALAMTPFTRVSEQLSTAYEGLDPNVYPGANIYFWDEGRELPDAEPFPAPEDVRAYWAPYTYDDCRPPSGNKPGGDELKLCESEGAPEHPTAKILLTGGSLGGHWQATFDALSRKYGWKIYTLQKDSCPFGADYSDKHSRCKRYNDNVVKWLADNPMDLVVTSGSRTDEAQDHEYYLQDAPKMWEQVTATGADLMLIRGIAMDRNINIPDCVAEGGSAQECGPPKKWLREDPIENIDLPKGAHTVDMTQYVCPAYDNADAKNCDAVVGNILISYSDGHFTAPFAASLAPAMEREMKKDFGWLLK